jgi:hypothetical protein
MVQSCDQDRIGPGVLTAPDGGPALSPFCPTHALDHWRSEIERLTFYVDQLGSSHDGRPGVESGL